MLRTGQRLALDELCARDKEIDELHQENRALKHQARGHMRRMESVQAHHNELDNVWQVLRSEETMVENLKDELR